MQLEIPLTNIFSPNWVYIMSTIRIYSILRLQSVLLIDSLLYPYTNQFLFIINKYKLPSENIPYLVYTFILNWITLLAPQRVHSLTETEIYTLYLVEAPWCWFQTLNSWYDATRFNAIPRFKEFSNLLTFLFVEPLMMLLGKKTLPSWRCCHHHAS